MASASSIADRIARELRGRSGEPFGGFGRGTNTNADTGPSSRPFHRRSRGRPRDDHYRPPGGHGRGP